MWFYNGDWGIYWLSKSATDAPNFDVDPPETADGRPASEGDVVYDARPIRLANGLNKNYFWITNKTWQLKEVLYVKEPFPKNPTYKSLGQWVKKLTPPIKAPGLIPLEKGVNLTVSETFKLTRNGWHLLIWSAPNQLRFSVSEGNLDCATKYLGSNFFLQSDNDVVGVKTESEWIPLISNLSIDQATGKASDVMMEAIKGYVKVYRDYQKVVDEYVSAISPAKVLLAAGELQSDVHAIITRCNGCQAFDSTHLRVHLDRKDLDLFLLYAAYESFEKNAPGGPSRHVWDLIEAVREQRGAKELENAKEILRRFMLYNLRFGMDLVFTPYPNEAKSNRWRKGAWRQFRIVDDRIVADDQPREGRPERFGQWIAAERRQAEVAINEDDELGPLVAAAERRLRRQGAARVAPQLVQRIREIRDGGARFRFAVDPVPPLPNIGPVEPNWQLPVAGGIEDVEEVEREFRDLEDALVAGEAAERVNAVEEDNIWLED